MKIEYYGHSCFRLIADDGFSIVCDPFGAIGLPLPRLSADLITISHAHYDHNNASAVDAPEVLDRAGEYERGGVSIRAFPAFHDDAMGRKRGSVLIFEFLIDGLKICHLGDLGEAPSRRLLAQIGKPDVLLIPVGGNYTIDAGTAHTYICLIDPAFTIPMHYALPGSTVDIDPPEAFLSRFPREEIRFAHCNHCEFPPQGTTANIIVLDAGKGI